MEVIPGVRTETVAATVVDSQSLFPYTLLTRLGTGSQGTTYLATHDTTGEVVAVKVFRLADADGWKAHELFERECAVLSALDHPAIPRFIATHSDAESDRVYLVMSLVKGEPLHHRVRGSEPLDAEALTGVLEQMLDVLAYLHSRHPAVIHRDIKPRNILRDDTGKVSLVDFGGVRVALRPEGGSTSVGTFGYMAPEQLHGAATPATDIYALGATLAALATGHDASDLPRKGLRIDLSNVMAAGPLRSLITEMTAPNPDERLPDVDAVSAALQRLQALPGEAPKRRQGAVEDSAPRSRPRHLPAGPLGLVLRLVLLALWLASSTVNSVLGIVERVVLPARYKQRRKKLKQRYGHRPDKHDTLAGRLDTRHRQTLGAVRQTRNAMRAVAQKSEPYRGRDGQQARPPRHGRRRR